MHFARFATTLATVFGLVAWHDTCGVVAKEGSVRAAEPDQVAVVPRHSPESTQRSLADPRELQTSFKMDFEGVQNGASVAGFYDGEGGPDYGVVFGASAFCLIDSDVSGGGGNFANEPSASTVMFFRDDLDAVMSFATGFEQLDFKYTSRTSVVVSVYAGPGGTGNVIINTTFASTGVCEEDGIDPCGDPNGSFGRWNSPAVGITDRGGAQSIVFSGFPSNSFAIDDMIITPVAPPPCTKTTYWLWDPTTDALVGELQNNTARCIAVPYNIEVRPCTPPTTNPVTITLMNAATGGTLKTQKEYFAPFYLWGDATATGDVYRNTRPLPAGTYRLSSTMDGVAETIEFTKTC